MGVNVPPPLSEIENQKNFVTFRNLKKMEKNEKNEKNAKETGCKKITKIKRGVGYRRKDAV